MHGFRSIRRLAALAAALVTTVGLLAVASPAAQAEDTTTDLGISLSSYRLGGDVAAGGGHIFVSADDRIIATDAAGQFAGAFLYLSYVADLATNADGTRLYAALRGSNEVIEINAANPAILRRIDLAAYPCPSHLALKGSRMWIGYGCETREGGVVSLDLSDPEAAPNPLVSGRYGTPKVAAAGDRLVFGDTGINPSSLFVYDVSAASPTLLGEIDGHDHSLYNLQDLALSPDGAMLVSAFGSPYRHDAWDTTTLTKIRSYGESDPFRGYPAAARFSADGKHLALGWTRDATRNIELYEVATGAILSTKTNSAGDMVEGSIAFSGSDMVSVLRTSGSDALHLWRAEGPGRKASTLILRGLSEAPVQQRLDLTGRLALAGESAPGAQPLKVTRQHPDGTTSTIEGVTTAEDGSFTVEDVPQALGRTTYEVSWEGNADHLPSSVSFTVTLRAQETAVTLTGPTEEVAGRQLQLSGRLTFEGQAPGAGHSLKVTRTVQRGDRTIILNLPAVTTAVDGRFTFSDTPAIRGQYTYKVVWAGTELALSAEASHAVAVSGRLG
ncbi:hypothetical protein ACIBH1_19280 [Nonomuraea sp. NPDC050663]|uniref:hypothetical protein n=1 Tax=Nonomuraea sp. NPDC050663 TaxID=3364370 RepID=UPI0037B6E58E